MNAGEVSIEQLAVRCIIGDLPRERKIMQEIMLDVRMVLDFSYFKDKDDLSDTVNYVELASVLSESIQSKRYRLIETLVYNEVNSLLERFPKIYKLSIKVTKTGCVPDAQKTYAFYEKERQAVIKP